MIIKNSIRFFQILSISFLFLGLIYIILGDYYMGFERDLVYREYILKKEYLVFLNPLILSLFWIVCFAFTCKQIYTKFSFHKLFHLGIYLLISISSFLYMFDILESIMLFVIVTVFGFLRVLIDILRIKSPVEG